MHLVHNPRAIVFVVSHDKRSINLSFWVEENNLLKLWLSFIRASVMFLPRSEDNGEGDALNGSHTHPSYSIAIGPQCFNQTGR